jgi:hypothetical protein
MTWWESYREVYFQLMTLSTAMPWDLPKGKRRIYSSGIRRGGSNDRYNFVSTM